MTSLDRVYGITGRLPISPHEPFGYHSDTELVNETGINPVLQGNVLIGGMEQAKFLPPATLAFGVRHTSGFEAWTGPNVSVSGFGIIFSVGYIIEAGGISYPLNLSYAMTDDSRRLSFTTDFNFPK